LSLTSLLTFSQTSYLLVGTYTTGTSKGIYVYKFNSATGDFDSVSMISTPNPSFLSVSGDEKFVYAVHEIAKGGNGGEIAAFSFDKKSGQLQLINQQLSGGDHPCYVDVDKTGKWIASANYTSGSLSLLPVNNTGGLETAKTTIQHSGYGPNADRQKGPHAHSSMFSPDNKFLLSADLGIDKLLVYSFNSENGSLTNNDSFVVEPGGGPRHFTFHPSGKYVYLIDEMTSMIHVLGWKKGKLRALQNISSVPPMQSGSGSADIHVSPDGKFLYASNRASSNTIAIFKIDQKTGELESFGFQSTFGKTPRNFNFDPSGNFLLVANQDSDEIVIFKRNKDSGMLLDSKKRIKVGNPVCIKWIGL
jgi:6-phosphogluconolactonase